MNLFPVPGIIPFRLPNKPNFQPLPTYEINVVFVQAPIFSPHKGGVVAGLAPPQPPCRRLQTSFQRPPSFRRERTVPFDVPLSRSVTLPSHPLYCVSARSIPLSYSLFRIPPLFWSIIAKHETSVHTLLRRPQRSRILHPPFFFRCTSS